MSKNLKIGEIWVQGLLSQSETRFFFSANKRLAIELGGSLGQSEASFFFSANYRLTYPPPNLFATRLFIFIKKISNFSFKNV